MSPTRQPKGLRFGEKVRVALKRNGEQGLTPDSPKALADALRMTNPKVYRALKTNAPKLDVAYRIARALGESLDFLADPSRDFNSREPGEKWDRFVAGLTPDERDHLADVASRPDVKRLLFAAFDRRAAVGPAAPSRPT